MRLSRRSVLGLIGCGAASVFLPQLGGFTSVPFGNRERGDLWLEFDDRRHRVVSIERGGIWFDAGEDVDGTPMMALHRCTPSFVPPQSGTLRV